MIHGDPRGVLFMGVKAVVSVPVRPADEILLGGVVRASALRIVASVLLDVAAFAALAAIVVVWARSADSPYLPVLLALAGLAFIAVQLTALARHGHTLGRLLLGLRAVDHRTASPVGFAPSLALLTFAPALPRFVHARLRLGRDPLARAFQPVPAGALVSAAAGPQAPAPVARGRQRAQFAAATASAIPSAIRDAAPVPAGMPDAAGRPDAAGMTDAAGTAAHERPADEARAGESLAGEGVRLILDSGEQLSLDRPVLIGRSPTQLPTLPVSTLYAWADLSRTISKTHALLEWTGTAVKVTDLGSTNGTAISSPTDSRTLLFPFQPQHVGPGGRIELGDRVVQVDVGDPRQSRRPTLTHEES